MATVATGTPLGICTIDNNESDIDSSASSPINSQVNNPPGITVPDKGIESDNIEVIITNDDNTKIGTTFDKLKQTVPGLSDKDNERIQRGRDYLNNKKSLESKQEQQQENINQSKTKQSKEEKKADLKKKTNRAKTGKKSQNKYKITDDYQLMELNDGTEIWVNTEEETQEDIFKAYLFIDKSNRGDVIGTYNSVDESLTKI